MASGWTQDRKARQSELIRAWRPWEQSSGPKTEAGKAVVARNAWKGGSRQLIRELCRALNMQRDSIKKLEQAATP